MEHDSFSILDLIDLDMKEHNQLNLRCVAGRKGLSREITVPEVNRPGLALTGFYEPFAWERIQLFGHGEVAFLKKLESEGSVESVKRLFSWKLPCCIFAANLPPTRTFLEEAEKSECAVLQTDIETSDFNIRISRILSNIFSPVVHLHGVFMEIYGMGVLLTGPSGIGKSEIALELVKAGHRLVADDTVEIHCINGNILQGTGDNKIIGHHMEIRGIGIVNIATLFGIGAIRQQKQVQFVVKLSEWDTKKYYDRLGSDDSWEEILGVKVPSIEIPVSASRNIPIVIETAVMNERLKTMGYNAAREFNRNVMRWLENESERAVYFGQNRLV
jgi:HPr kinase/phosphorylase